MKRFLVAAAAIFLCLTAAGAQTGSKFTIEDLLKVQRVGDPQLSPDGQWVVFSIAVPNLALNKSVTQIYLVSANGGDPRQLTTGDRSSSSARWSPDGKQIAFISSREGSPQIWTMDVKSGDTKKVSDISTGAADPVWSPNGQWIAFASDIHPECTTDDCNKQLDQKMDESKVKAKIATRLLYRHWTSWKEGRRTHVFVVSTSGGTARDLTPGDFDAPPFSLGGPADYAFSPDSGELAFARNTDKVEATSTNADIFLVPVTGGEAKRITGNNHGADLSPQYSPDGRYIAYRSQVTPGFESDRWRLMLYDRKTGTARSVTEKQDSLVQGFTFSRDGKTIFFVSDTLGVQPIFSLDIASGSIRKVVTEGFNDDVNVSADGRTLVFSRNNSTHPTEIYRANVDGTSIKPLTGTNDRQLAPFNLKPVEAVQWTGAAGATVHGWVVKPTNFDPAKKWPLVVLIHGGPQGAWEDNWGYRWNPQVFANAGYVVFMPNPRGSTGYGQKFTDEISGDWGGKAYVDIMNGVASVISSNSYIDKQRIGAAGASYGGYMVNWILGHNNDPRFKFSVLVSHDGVFNITGMFGSTEELWFPLWEFKGTPWDNPELYNKWSPHMFVKNFKTPTLVIHSDLDYRLPLTEGLQLFTALQMQGVDSKLLVFPDEGHWVLKPQNSQLWYHTVLDWLGSHLS
jgi:dipeptidyl aminopeptidase/acylaminoacyl peptidase